MSLPANITAAIVDALYEDALALSEEARAVFDERYQAPALFQPEPEMRIAMSCEALRTTTRLMHALAWLLNQKAYLNGEMSEFQLRRHGRLPPAEPASDPKQLALLDARTHELIERSRAFYARVARIDAAWRKHFAMQPAAIHRLKDRLGQAYAVH